MLAQIWQDNTRTRDCFLLMMDLDASAYGLSHRNVSKKRGNPKIQSDLRFLDPAGKELDVWGRKTSDCWNFGRGEFATTNPRAWA
jgi:hypothetical protein